MIALVEQADGSYVEEERGEPECGTHFCDKCGDCLHCYGGDPCYTGSTDQHMWVVYRK